MTSRRCQGLLSKRRQVLDCHPRTGHRVQESQLFRMQLHALGLARRMAAIQAIASNRRVQALWVGRMHAKLV